MTTGRINQVTIVTRGCHQTVRTRGGSRAPGESREATGVIACRSECTRKWHPAGTHVRDRSLRKTRHAAIHLPPLSSPRTGPPQTVMGRRRSHSRTLQHTALKRRIPLVCHARRRLQAEADPRISEKDNVRHRPTIHRLHPRRREQIPPGFRPPSSGPGEAAPPEGRAPRAVGWGDNIASDGANGNPGGPGSTLSRKTRHTVDGQAAMRHGIEECSDRAHRSTLCLGLSGRGPPIRLCV